MQPSLVSMKRKALFKGVQFCVPNCSLRDRLLTHFIPCRNSNDASHVADLLFRDVYKLHGLPHSIVSDRDTKFLGHFWRALWKRMRNSLDYSIASHSQIDGQTEVVNQSLRNLLRCLVRDHPKKWEVILPIVEFAFNISVNRSSSYSLFEIVYGNNLSSVTDLVALPESKKVHPKAKDMVGVMQQVHQQVKIKLKATNVKNKATADF